jgi:hypothetical protein
MGRRKKYDPRDYQAVDVEAALADIPGRSPSSETPDEPAPRRRRRRSPGPSHSPHGDDVPLFWLVCPCKHYEGGSRPHTRLYSTVLKHISQNKMGEKFQVPTSTPLLLTYLQCSRIEDMDFIKGF